MDGVIKKTTVILFVLVFPILGGIEAKASWLIDAKKFQSSAHGETSCEDCHETAELDLHPNPEDVYKKSSDFFDEDQCYSCHEDTREDLQDGFHGEEIVKNPKEYEYCFECHDSHYEPGIGEEVVVLEESDLPPLSDEDQECMACHNLIAPGDPEGEKHIAELCFSCHAQSETPAQEITGKIVPLINIEAYRSTPHVDDACTVCHLKATVFPHGNKPLADCRECHPPHHEKITHDAHTDVSCEVCHLESVQPIKDPDSNRILWKTIRNFEQASIIHRMAPPKGIDACRSCHFKENKVGADAMILPAKSILCMPCHAATFSIGDTTTLFAVIIFLTGFIMVLSYVTTGSVGESKDSGTIRKLFAFLWEGIQNICLKKILFVIKAVFFDVLLQRRLHRQSVKRWLIHSLIFLPFVFRFSWGLFSLFASLWIPEWAAVWDMLNKNHPVTAFVFDMTGLMITLGIAFALIRGIRRQSGQPLGLPRQDHWALGLIAGIVIVGFILEGMRIAMTGWPDGAKFAFGGYAISTMFSNSSGLQQSYGYVWYLHAIITGGFVAYLPFSRLLHMIIAPLILTMNAAFVQNHKRKANKPMC